MKTVDSVCVCVFFSFWNVDWGARQANAHIGFVCRIVRKHRIRFKIHILIREHAYKEQQHLLNEQCYI